MRHRDFQNTSLKVKKFQVRHVARRNAEQGVALVIVLLLLAMIGALGVGMVLSMGSDMMINGYYRNYRGSFYAADSGLNIARAQLGNQVIASVPNTPAAFFATPPIADQTASASAALTYLETTYLNFGSLNNGQAAKSWSENFKIIDIPGSCINTFGPAPGYPVVTATNANGQPTHYKYIFNYKLCAIGGAQAQQQVVTSELGAITLDIQSQSNTTANSQVSFAAFGAFVDNYPPCLGPLVPGTMTGPMFTNGAWQFMTGGAYIFTDPVSQANAKADYWFNWSCVQSPTSSYTSGAQTIAPSFQGGLNLGQPNVPLPPNSFSQKWAAIDGLGRNEAHASPTNADMNAALKTISGTAYPTTGATSGVYLPYSNSGGVNTLSGGGIYVEGNASVTMSIGTDASGNKTQIYSITQSGTTTTVTTNTTANTTTVASGGSTLNLAGIPSNLNGATPQPATMLFVNGNITGLTGPGQGQPAVQDGSAITITATGNVSITGDIVYKTEPVTTTQNQSVAGTTPACCNGSPVATLIPGHDNNQVLGIFTSAGNIDLQSPYANHNLQVDGSLAAIGQGCASNSCGFTVTGHIDTFDNVGGQIQGNIFGADMNTQNTYFDRRFTARPGFAPPWFPSTTISAVDIVNGLPPVVTQTVQRISWVTTPQ